MERAEFERATPVRPVEFVRRAAVAERVAVVPVPPERRVTAEPVRDARVTPVRPPTAERETWPREPMAGSRPPT